MPADSDQPPENAAAGADAVPVRLLFIAAFGSILLNLSTTTVNVALDQLMAAFDAPIATIQWVVTGYLLALTLVLPTFRFIVSRMGSRRLYVACLVGFCATSALSALAWNAPSLIAFRIVQGAVGGLLAPLAQTLIAELAGPKNMGRGVSILSVPALAAPIFGPVVGGLVLHWLSWRWLFLINAPIGVIGAYLAHTRLPRGTEQATATFDVRGLSLLAPGLALVTYAVSAHAFTWPLVVAAALLAVFVLDARRRPTTALLDLRLFKNPVIVGALITFLLTAVASFGAQLVLPLYYQRVRGESALVAGLLLAPQGLGMLVTLPQVGRLTDRIGPGKIVVVGVLLTILGTLALTQVTATTPYWLLCATLVLRGAGLGATNTPALAAAYRHIEKHEIANATTAINIVQRLGAPLGTATLALALQQFLASAPSPSDAYAHTFAVALASSALALVAAVFLAKNDARPR